MILDMLYSLDCLVHSTHTKKKKYVHNDMNFQFLMIELTSRLIKYIYSTCAQQKGVGSH